MGAVVAEHEIEEEVVVAQDRWRHTLKDDGLSEALASQALPRCPASLISNQVY